MADRPALSGVILPTDPVLLLEAITKRYADALAALDPANSDGGKYGAAFSSISRDRAAGSVTVTNATTYLAGGVAKKAFTPAAFRFYLDTAGGTVSTPVIYVAVLAGTLTALTYRGSVSVSGLQSTGLKELILGSVGAVSAGEVVFGALLTTGYSTAIAARASSLAPPAALVSPAASKWVATTAGSQTALPAAPVNANAQTAGGQPLWFEVTAAA